MNVGIGFAGRMPGVLRVGTQGTEVRVYEIFSSRNGTLDCNGDGATIVSANAVRKYGDATGGDASPANWP